MTRKTQLLLGILGLLPCLACFSPSEGDRTTSGTCPEGETCSTTTPGLFFRGTLDVGDGSPAHVGVVAVGGTEQVVLLAGSSLETATAFTGSVDVVSDAPNVLAVDSVAGSMVTVRGVSEGSAFLRVLEHGTTTLIDRVQVTVITVDETFIRPIALDGTDANVLTGHTRPWFAMLDGARVELGVAMSAIEVIVDASLTVTDAAGTELVSGAGGAPYRFTVTASASSPARFRVHAAGHDTEIDIPVVTQIDGIRFDAPPAGAGTTRRVCATPRSGGFDVAGTADPVFTATGVRLGEQHGRCVDFTAGGSTSGGTVTATIAGFSAGTAI